MNKRGEGLVQIQTVEFAFLIVLVIFFSVRLYQPIEENKLNQIKAEDLALSIESLPILNGDLRLDYKFGDEYYIEEINNVIFIYKLSEVKKGRSKVGLENSYDFAENINDKTEAIVIEKKGKKVVIY